MITNNIAHLETTTDSHYLGLPIMCSDSNECYVNILNKGYRELTRLQARYSRIVLVRLDVKIGKGTYAGNVEISKFRKSFVRKLERRYKTKVAYQWVREYGKSEDKNPTHWHWWVAVNASDKEKPDTQAEHITLIINEAWIEHTRNRNSYVQMSGYFFLARKYYSPTGRRLQQDIIANGPSKEKGEVLINRSIIAAREDKKVLGGVIDECFFAMSYLAKVYTKTRTKNTKWKPIFGNSNLNMEDPRSGRQQEIEKNLSQILISLQEPLEAIPMVYKAKKWIEDESSQFEPPVAELTHPE